MQTNTHTNTSCLVLSLTLVQCKKKKILYIISWFYFPTLVWSLNSNVSDNSKYTPSVSFTCRTPQTHFICNHFQHNEFTLFSLWIMRLLTERHTQTNTGSKEVWLKPMWYWTQAMTLHHTLPKQHTNLVLQTTKQTHAWIHLQHNVFSFQYCS